MGFGCVSSALYAAVVPGVALAFWLGFQIGRIWERELGRGKEGVDG